MNLFPVDSTPIPMSEAQTQWFNRPRDQRFESLKALQAAVDARATASFERVVTVSDVTARTLGGDGIDFVSSDRPEETLVPTNWAFGQICSRIIGAPASYIRKLSPALAVENLNYGFKKLTGDEETSAKLLSTDYDDRTELRSATSPTYGRIWDSNVVAAVQKIVDDTGNVFFNPPEWGGRPSGLYASDHDVFMFLIDGGSIVTDGNGPAVNGARDHELHRGFFVWNSEVGSAVFGIQTFLFSYTCGNHMVWGPTEVKALKIRHTAGAPERFVAEATPRLLQYANLSVDSFQQTIRKAKEYATPRDKEESVKWLREKGFTNSEARRAISAAEREEGGYHSLWLLVQGLTATAREMAFTDARVELETRAGKLLDLAA